jgi:hypothetical protein
MTDPRMAVGASVWVKGSCVTNDCELHRRYGSNAKTIYIPGIVTRGFLQPSQRGRNMKYIEAVFYYGGSDTKSATVPMSQVKWELPILAPYPEGLDLFRADKGVVRMQGLDSPSTASSVTMDPTAARDEVEMNTIVRVINEGPPRVSLDNSDTNSYPVVTVNGIDWSIDETACRVELNGRRIDYEWSMKDVHGNLFRQFSDTTKKLSRLDYFLMMFPPSAIRHMTTLTNIELDKMGESDMDFGELIQFLGIILLITRADFPLQRYLWSTESFSKYLPPFAFGWLGMTRNRFKAIWTCL